MKIKLEIDVPEYDWVAVPTLYRTPLGDYDDENHVIQVRVLFKLLQQLDVVVEWLINTDDHHTRESFCVELVRMLPFIPEEQVQHVGEKLGRFLTSFNEKSGLKFKEYEFKPTEVCNGYKVRLKGFDMLFNTTDDALRHITNAYISGSDFKYEVVK